jgi:hypothetical protein
MLNSREMTLQDVFNVVWERAKNPVKSRLGISGVCAYRGAGGLKCFIGECISDEDYSICNEGKTVLDTEVASLFPGLNSTVLRDLQRIHDVYVPSDWKTNLEFFAKTNNLQIPVEQ